MTQSPQRMLPAGWRSLSGDRGSGTVLVLALAAVIVLVAGLLGLLAASFLAHARAQGAADLAALGAAERLQRQSVFTEAADSPPGADGPPCALAGAVAEHNRARLVACRTEPAGIVTVEVAVDSPGGSARAQARAGPRPTAARGPDPTS